MIIFKGNISSLFFKQIHNPSQKKWKNIVHIQTLMAIFKEIHGPCHKNALHIKSTRLLSRKYINLLIKIETNIVHTCGSSASSM